MKTALSIRLLCFFLTANFCLDMVVASEETRVILEVEKDADANESKVESESESDKQTNRHHFHFASFEKKWSHKLILTALNWTSPSLEINSPPPEMA